MAKPKPNNLEELFEQYRKEDEDAYYGAITGELKRLYSDDLLKGMIYKDNPLLKSVKKGASGAAFTGATYTMPNKKTKLSK